VPRPVAKSRRIALAPSGARDHLREASNIVGIASARLRFRKAVWLVAASSTAHTVRIGQGIKAIAERLQALPSLSIRRALGEARQGSTLCAVGIGHEGDGDGGGYCPSPLQHRPYSPNPGRPC
jgi:hypothetical protein